MGKGRWALLSGAVAMALAALVCYRWYSAARLEDIKGDVLAQIDLIQEIVLTGEYDYHQVADRAALHTGSRITLLARDGTLLADSAWSQITFPSFLYDKEILLARQGQIGTAILPSPITGRNTLHMTKPGHGPLGQEIIIRVAYDLTDYDTAMGGIRMGMLLAALGGCLWMLWGGSLYRLRVRPAPQALARYVEAVSSGRPIQWREGDGGEELHRLADSINALLAHNEDIIRATDRKHSRINTILGSMDSGLLAVDSQNQVVLFNAMAEGLAQLDKGVFFDGGDKGAASPTARRILEGTARVIDGRRQETATLTVEDGRMLEVHITPIVNKYTPYDDLGALAVIKDVTQMKKLEALRSEFVANVSHELRTPLALISGFVETLSSRRDLSERETDRALEIMGIETKRLSGLISQLLTLSKIENDLMPRDDQQVDIPAEVDGALAALDNLARNKGVTLAARLPRDLPPVPGNAAWVRQVILNLCENAIKYTPAGGRVRVKVWADGSTVRVSVKDNGMGIPQRDLPRLFERFYRVDKSRGSQDGGNGLGLAIAKHMVTEMGGQIWAKSRGEGQGSEFVAAFPLGPAGGAGEE